MVKLEDFISETLAGIASGANQAAERMREAGHGVMIDTVDTTDAGHVDQNFIREVEFDVSVTYSEEETTRGGFAVILSPVAGRAEDQDTTLEEHAARITFSIPLNFVTYPPLGTPTGDVPEETDTEDD